MLRYILTLTIFGGVYGEQFRILNGESVLIQDHPYAVSLQYSGQHTCGGSIISAEWILTAGHCVEHKTGELTIRAGSSFSDREGHVYSVDHTIVHDQFGRIERGVLIHDIALVHLAEPLIFDETKRPVELFQAKEESVAGSLAVVVGWGDTLRVPNNQQLQKITVPIVSKVQCDEAYKIFANSLPAGQICAGLYGRGGKDACNRDSGGPLTVSGHLAGIISWGNGCGKAMFPGVYTEVAHYREWIRDHTGI